MPVPPSCYHAMASATVIANLSASDETTGKDLYRRELVKTSQHDLLAATSMQMPVRANHQQTSSLQDTIL